MKRRIKKEPTYPLWVLTNIELRILKYIQALPAINGQGISDASKECEFPIKVGSVYAILQKLESKNLIHSWICVGIKSSIGVSIRKYNLSEKGFMILMESEKLSVLWESYGG